MTRMHCMQQTGSCDEILLDFHRVCSFYLNEPVKWQDLACVAIRKKICQHPMDILCLSVQFFHLIRDLWDGMP